MSVPKVSIQENEVQKIMTTRLNSTFEVVKFSTEMLGQWIGMCGDHAVLHVTTREEIETEFSFFMKLYPRLESIIEFIEGIGSFRKEIFIYKFFDLMTNEGVKILSETVPKCYLTVPKKFLVLENLSEQGYVSVNKHELFDYDTIIVVLEVLAQFHASSLIYEEKKCVRLNDIYAVELEDGYFSDQPNSPNKPGIEAAIVGILKLVSIFDFPQKLLSGKDFRTVLEQVCNKVYKLAKPSKTFRNVICHGDIWATNLVLKYANKKPVKCKLVDFQCARYTPPAQDVMAVIYLTTSRKFREKYMYRLIGIYYRNLEKHITLAGYDMKKIISFDEFLASCEEQKVFGMVQTAIYFPLILLKSEVAQEFFGNQEANREALFVDRSIVVRENMNTDERYKKRISDAIQDLKDYCDYL